VVGGDRAHQQRRAAGHPGHRAAQHRIQAQPGNPSERTRGGGADPELRGLVRGDHQAEVAAIGAPLGQSHAAPGGHGEGLGLPGGQIHQLQARQRGAAVGGVGGRIQPQACEAEHGAGQFPDGRVPPRITQEGVGACGRSPEHGRPGGLQHPADLGRSRLVAILGGKPGRKGQRHQRRYEDRSGPHGTSGGKPPQYATSYEVWSAR